jgi:PAS domain S-box-containing protein
MDKKLDGSDRRKAENERRADEIRLSTIYNTVRDVIFVLSVESQDRYRFVSVNRRFLEITGLSEEQVVGKLFTEVIPEPAQPLVLAKYREALRSGKPASWEEVSAYPAGVRVGEVTVAPVFEAEGICTQLIGTVHDITDRKRAEEQIRQSLAEKETLLREIYHRTKNNMNVIAAMLSLKARTSGDEALGRTFGEIEEKIKAMALVHEKLYKSRDLSRIDFREYVSDLAALLMRSRASSAKDLTLVLDMAPLAVSIDVAIPCGMILTELFSNTFKHAFPDRKKGEIRIAIHRADDAIELFYADNGAGIPPGFDFRSRASLGLQTVFVLVEHQLQGQAVFEGKGGVSCRIRFHDTAGRAGSEL